MGYSLNDLGLSPKQIDEMMIQVSGNLDNDPSYMSKSDINKIFQNSFI